MFDFINQMPPEAAVQYGIMLGLTGREMATKGFRMKQNRDEKKQQ